MYTRKGNNRLDKDEIAKIQAAVFKRDKGRCVLTGKRNVEVHELLFRSSSRKNSSRVFQMKYMACLSSEVHTRLHFQGQKEAMTTKIFRVLEKRHGYVYDELKKNK